MRLTGPACSLPSLLRVRAARSAPGIPEWTACLVPSGPQRLGSCSRAEAVVAVVRITCFSHVVSLLLSPPPLSCSVYCFFFHALLLFFGFHPCLAWRTSNERTVLAFYSHFQTLTILCASFLFLFFFFRPVSLCLRMSVVHLFTPDEVMPARLG